MKTDIKLRKALLTDEEIQILLDYYDRIIEDGVKLVKNLTGKPIERLMADQIAIVQSRRADIARFTDGRWTNRGKGRPKKETAPSLPLNEPRCSQCGISLLGHDIITQDDKFLCESCVDKLIKS